jgi:transmembrane sensor
MSDPGAIVPFPDLKAIEAQAAEWLTLLESEGVTPQDLAAFNAWRDQSAQHREVLARLAARWLEFDRLEALNAYLAPVDIGTPERTPSQAAGWSRRSILVGSSAAALAGAAALYLNPQIFGNVNPSIVQTAIGERKTTKLNDGSIVELNTKSLIAISYSESTRKIHLLEGEAYFDVAPNSQRPFLVYTKTGTIRAVGTAFTVRLHDENVNVTVQEGRVALLSPPPNTPDAEQRAVYRGTEPSVVLQAGQDAVFADGIKHIKNLDAAALNRKLSWRNGVLSFSGEPLSDVLADMSRYTDIVIELDDETLRKLPVDGYFKIGTLDTMLEALEMMAHLKTERLGPRRIRLSKQT